MSGGGHLAQTGRIRVAPVVSDLMRNTVGDFPHYEWAGAEPAAVAVP